MKLKYMDINLAKNLASLVCPFAFISPTWLYFHFDLITLFEKETSPMLIT
jgi:hypothetical protein